MPLISMRIFQIKRIISSEKWFNHVVIYFFFLENDKTLGRSDDAKRRKKEDGLKAKKISHVFSWRQTWANGVTWAYKVASFVLEIIPLQVSCKAMIGDYKLHRAFSLTWPLD